MGLPQRALVLALLSLTSALRVQNEEESSTSQRLSGKVIGPLAQGRDAIFEFMEDAGAQACTDTRRPLKLFARSTIAGICVGCGGLLCSSVGGDMGIPFWAPGGGLQRLAFGAIGFPLSILMVSLSGASAFTANLALAANALRKGRATVRNALALLGITYAGCFTGAGIVAGVAVAGDLPGCVPATAIAAHKLKLSALQTFVRGIGGGWLISCAVTFAISAMKMGGSIIDIIVAIWFPISTYVISDFEHCLANFFFMLTALFRQNARGDDLFKLKDVVCNFVWSTLGNVVGAGVIGGTLLPMACGPESIVVGPTMSVHEASPSDEVTSNAVVKDGR
eukprot:CAMPEP_0119300566 /NCGR_PEP_ID=MMETSP1333-20130426/2493_1 /TAXON_ID=418940 /ORGANISM="Scyphosphaera apsteinii, Strain RCC1455" /LENGTH=335 /DNA_ID=CAMNT_0007302383 /DNA_START=236 /DNA_END=1243 /DNA_ORIENTATION=-